MYFGIPFPEGPYISQKKYLFTSDPNFSWVTGTILQIMIK